MENRRGVSFFVFVFGLMIVFAQTAYAEKPGRILSNSEDWRDVYSVIMYGNLVGTPANFLVSDKHATLILNSIQKDSHIWAISSKKVPYLIGYKNVLESKGYTAEEFVFDNANIELAKKLDSISNFIVIDDSYGYNAISVAPYAAVTKSYVLFADKSNIKDIDKFLSATKISRILIYGNVDREVKSALSKFNPEVINKDGDRFLNNIEIVKKYQEIKNSKQAVLTNGEFIEQEIMSGSEPVLFIGTNNVPDVIREYVKKSSIQVGVLIGNELVGTATIIRRQMGISVFVKFAQGARAPKGAISQVEALDMFYLPIYSLNIELESVKYNKATNKLEVALRNTQSQAVYFIGTYSLTASDKSRQTVGDSVANFIDANEVKTVTYDVEPMADAEISADVFIIYGESKGSLEKEIRKTLQVQTVKVLDECDVKISKVAFGKSSKSFYIGIENNGKVDCYADAEIIDVLISGEKNTFGANKPIPLKSGASGNIIIKADKMEPEDIAENEKVKVRVYYGERENTLVKVIEGTYDLGVKSFDLISAFAVLPTSAVDYGFYLLLIVIVFLIIFVIRKRRKKKSD